MRILIVDDERLARLRLRQLLGEIAGVEVVAEAANAEEALAQVAALHPDLVLLDIQMPGLSGLSLAKGAAELPPVIFTTAHREHALEAFEVAAVDYLLKPIQQERLRAALEKARPRVEQRAIARVNDLLSELRATRRSDEAVRITARDRDSYQIFDAREVARFHAADKYVVCALEGREIVLDQSLSELERLLKDHDFMRVHRGELVNLRRVRRVTLDRRACTLELSDGQTVSVSRRFIAEIKRRLGLP